MNKGIDHVLQAIQHEMNIFPNCLLGNYGSHLGEFATHHLQNHQMSSLY